MEILQKFQKFNKADHSVKNLSVLYRYIFTYFILILIPFIVFGFFVNHTVRTLNEEVEAAYEYKVKQVVEYVDNQFEEMFLSAFRISFNSILKPYYLKLNSYNNIQAISEIKWYKKEIPVTEDCLLYLYGTDEIYNSAGKYMTEIYFKNVLELDNWKNFIANAEDTREYRIERLENINYNGKLNDSIIAVVYPISTNNTNVNDAAVIYLITQDSLKSRVQSLIGENIGEMKIFDSQKSPIILLNETSKISDANYQKILWQKKGNINYIYEGKEKYSVFRADSDKLGLTFTMTVMVNQYTEQVGNFRKVIFAIILITFLFCVFLIIVFAYSNFRPIRAIQKKINETTSGESFNKKGNELLNISDMVQYTISKNNQLNSRINEQNKWMRYQILYSLLKGKADIGLLEKLKTIIRDFNGPYYVVIAVTFSELKINDGNVTIDKILDVIDACRSDKQVVCGVEIQQQNRIAAVYSIAENSDESLKEISSELLKKMKALGVSVRIGAGNIYEKIEKIVNSYMEAMSALEWNAEKSDKEIVFFNEVVENYSDIIWYPSESLLILIQSLRQGDEKHAVENIDRMKKQIASYCPSQIMKRYVCFDITNAIIKIVKELIPDTNAGDLNLLSAEEDINEFFSNIRLWTIKICSKVNENNKNKKLEFTRDILRYVEENSLDINMGLEKMAEKYNTSIYYISKIFKDQTGIGFKEYIIKLRMEEAKRLLANSNKTVNEICELAGYSSISHFIKAFKSYQGITPIKYRNGLL